MYIMRRLSVYLLLLSTLCLSSLHVFAGLKPTGTSNATNNTLNHTTTATTPQTTPTNSATTSTADADTSASDTMPEADDTTTLQNAKSDLLQLDRDLSRLEHQILLPNRSLILFGLSAKSKSIISQLTVSIDDRPVFNHTYTALELESIKMGGMTEVFDNNLSKGHHTFAVSLFDTFTQKTYSQQFDYNKTKDKSIIGIRFIERPPPRTLPIRLLEWPLDE